MDDTPEQNREEGRNFGAYLRERRQLIPPDVVALGSYSRTQSRVGKPITQEELAEAVDVSRTWYSLLEAGTAVASSALLGRLADALSLSPTDRLRFFQVGIPELGGPTVPDLIFPSAPSATPGRQRLSVPIASPSEIETAKTTRRDRPRENQSSFLTSAAIQARTCCCVYPRANSLPRRPTRQ